MSKPLYYEWGWTTSKQILGISNGFSSPKAESSSMVVVEELQTKAVCPSDIFFIRIFPAEVPTCSLWNRLLKEGKKKRKKKIETNFGSIEFLEHELINPHLDLSFLERSTAVADIFSFPRQQN